MAAKTRDCVIKRGGGGIPNQCDVILHLLEEIHVIDDARVPTAL